MESALQAESAKPRGARLKGVDTLRALAAILVVIGHDMHFVNELPVEFGGGIRLPLYGGGLGAVLLLFIAGFMSVYTGWSKFGEPRGAGRYLVRRASRLLPFYWLFTTMWLGIAAVAPRLVSQPFPPPREIVYSYLFIPFRRGDGGIFPALALGWTMNYIFLFDLITAAAIAVRRKAALIVIAASIVALMALHPFVPESMTAPYFWTGRYVLLFLAGVITCIAYKAWIEPRPALRVPAAISVVLLVLLDLYASRYLHGPFSFELTPEFVHLFPIVLVMGLLALLTAERSENWLTQLRDRIAAMSYSVYLSHPFSLGIVVMVWKKAGLYRYFPTQVLFFGGLVGALIAAFVIYTLVEAPLNKLVSRRHARKPEDIAQRRPGVAF